MSHFGAKKRPFSATKNPTRERRAVVSKGKRVRKEQPTKSTFVAASIDLVKSSADDWASFLDERFYDESEIDGDPSKKDKWWKGDWKAPELHKHWESGPIGEARDWWNDDSAKQDPNDRSGIVQVCEVNKPSDELDFFDWYRRRNENDPSKTKDKSSEEIKQVKKQKSDERSNPLATAPTKSALRKRRSDRMKSQNDQIQKDLAREKKRQRLHRALLKRIEQSESSDRRKQRKAELKQQQQSSHSENDNSKDDSSTMIAKGTSSNLKMKSEVPLASSKSSIIIKDSDNRKSEMKEEDRKDQQSEKDRSDPFVSFFDAAMDEFRAMRGLPVGGANSDSDGDEPLTEEEKRLKELRQLQARMQQRRAEQRKVRSIASIHSDSMFYLESSSSESENEDNDHSDMKKDHLNLEHDGPKPVRLNMDELLDMNREKRALKELNVMDFVITYKDSFWRQVSEMNIDGDALVRNWSEIRKCPKLTRKLRKKLGILMARHKSRNRRFEKRKIHDFIMVDE